MSDWSSLSLSTGTSLAKIENEINQLTDSDWDNKIETAKDMLGSRLENALAERGIDVNEEDSDVLLDVIVDPDIIFALTSDFLTLFLIYNDLSQGKAGGIYEDKAAFYHDIYEEQLAVDIKRMKLDINLDDETDVYRTNWVQRLTR